MKAPTKHYSYSFQIKKCKENKVLYVFKWHFYGFLYSF